MALVQMCPRCRDAYRLGEMRGQLCARCMLAITAEAKREHEKTALADDLVRGVTSKASPHGATPMGPITAELLEALQEARNRGEEIVKITLYETAWTGLSKESTSLKGSNDEGQRTFDGIPIFPQEGDPPNIPFVLEEK